MTWKEDDLPTFQVLTTKETLRLQVTDSDPALVIYDQQGRAAVTIHSSGSVTLHPDLPFDECAAVFVQRVNEFFANQRRPGWPLS